MMLSPSPSTWTISTTPSTVVLPRSVSHPGRACARWVISRRIRRRMMSSPDSSAINASSAEVSRKSTSRKVRTSSSRVGTSGSGACSNGLARRGSSAASSELTRDMSANGWSSARATATSPIRSGCSGRAGCREGFPWPGRRFAGLCFSRCVRFDTPGRVDGGRRPFPSALQFPNSTAELSTAD